MPDNTTPVTPQSQGGAGDSSSPMAGQAPSGDAAMAGQAPSVATGTPGAMTLDQATAIIAEMRRDLASSRSKLTAFEKAQQDADAAKLSDIDKANKRAADAESATAKQRERIAALVVERDAQKLGIIDPELAALAIARDLEYDDDGMPKNAEALLKKLLTDKPFLAANQQQQPGANRSVSSGGATNPGRASTAGGSAITWDYLRSITSTEYDARRAEIQQFMASHPRPR